ncbi:D-Ala-D-Ala dipeptidase vanX. Metallo peptidase. MEROPS family M15D [Pseudoxanthomonas sp. GM95]|uniref:M15 family metallopeptidase n=1 Tax=Pseudoxanthomonas sp. GM95 TaxID=1881043 RepID=UPI0008CDDE32|nr:M15 family metallopeptidase [Pseudoxanthomonas sp. GM95]SEK40165.1 D-Ala-D-Ala dipeptidase vanX. Metallo peptidase. MEROPS family M15D [Pseudoxanthomonas sp. GM95]
MRRALTFALALCAASAAHAATSVQVSPATTAAQANLVDIATLAPDVQREIRYASAHNFTGVRVDGYGAPKCLLLAPVAKALAQVQEDLHQQGLSLKVFDCYRPVRAVQAFMRWARDLPDQRMKAEFYPSLDKARIIPDGYVAEVSGHSRGATIDLTLTRCGATGCEDLDMGTPFDFFDRRANTAHAGLTAAQRDNRQRLLDAMQRRGFANYPMEWWHYTFQPEPTPTRAYDVPIR